MHRFLTMFVVAHPLVAQHGTVQQLWMPPVATWFSYDQQALSGIQELNCCHLCVFFLTKLPITPPSLGFLVTKAVQMQQGVGPFSRTDMGTKPTTEDGQIHLQNLLPRYEKLMKNVTSWCPMTIYQVCNGSPSAPSSGEHSGWCCLVLPAAKEFHVDKTQESERDCGPNFR